MDLKPKKTVENQHRIRITERICRREFGNQLRVYVLPEHCAKVVNLQAWVATGSIHEEESLGCGLSHFLEHMAFAGTPRFPGTAISDTVAHLGGELNAYTSYSNTVYHVDLPSDSWRIGLEMLDEMVRLPLFPEERFLKEKEVILRECAMYQDRPSSVLIQNLNRLMFRSHPMRHPVIGYQEKIAMVDREMMLKYYHKRYSPARTFYVVVGDVDPEEVFDCLEASGGQWALGRLDEPVLTPELLQPTPRVHSTTFNDPLYYTVTGWKTPAVSHLDIPALEVCSAILGGGESSRMSVALTQKKHLAHMSGSFCSSNPAGGYLAVYAIANFEKREKLLAEMQRQMDRMLRSGVTHAELEREITIQSADQIRALRTNAGMGRMIGSEILACGVPDGIDDYLDLIRKITPDEVKRVANEYLKSDLSSRMDLHPVSPKHAKPAPASKHRETVWHEDPKMRKHPGGVRMIYLQNDRLPLITLSLVFPSAPLYDAPAQCGVSKLLGETLSCGCRAFSEEAFNQFLDGHAIHLSVNTGRDSSIVKANCPVEQLPALLEAVGAMLEAPLFEDSVVDRARDALLGTIQSGMQDPRTRAITACLKAMYGDHPYSHAYNLPEKIMSSLTSEDVRRSYFSQMLNPHVSCISISGDLEEETAFQSMEALIDRIPWNLNAVLPKIPLPVFPSKKISQRIVIDKEQSVVVMGMPAMSLFSTRECAALDFLPIVTNHMSSRLLKMVREDASLAYYAGAQCLTGFHPGFLIYYGGTRPDASDQVLGMFQNELSRIAKQGLTQAEYDDAKAYLRYHHAQDVMQSDSLGIQAMENESFGIGYRYSQTYRTLQDGLTLAEINEIFAKLLSGVVTVSVIAGAEKKEKAEK